jgi:hypothetical protein
MRSSNELSIPLLVVFLCKYDCTYLGSLGRMTYTATILFVEQGTKASTVADVSETG